MEKENNVVQVKTALNVLITKIEEISYFRDERFVNCKEKLEEIKANVDFIKKAIDDKEGTKLFNVLLGAMDLVIKSLDNARQSEAFFHNLKLLAKNMDIQLTKAFATVFKNQENAGSAEYFQMQSSCIGQISETVRRTLYMSETDMEIAWLKIQKVLDEVEEMEVSPDYYNLGD